MKTKLILIGAFVSIIHTAFAQAPLTYYFPSKSFKVTVNYTEVTRKRIAKSNDANCNKVTICEKPIVIIKDPITIEEVVIPDLGHPVTLDLPKLSKAGASFNYSFQWAENGVASSFNATREPLAVSIISGAVGLFSTAVSAFTKAVGIGAAPTTEYSEVTEEKKFQHVEWIEISCEAPGEKEIKLQGYESAPIVKISFRRVMQAQAVSSGSGNVTVKSKIPSYYALTAVVTGNNGLPPQTVIDTRVAVPQCGANAEYKFELMKGKRTIAFQMSPSTGMLTKLEYKKESNFKASQGDVQSAITQLAQAVADVKQAQDAKQFKEIDAEIEMLKKENERAQLLKTKAELEKTLGNN